MTMHKYIFLTSLLLAALASCAKWTEDEAIRPKIVHPWEVQPAVWEQYAASLYHYKSVPHYRCYARLDNAPDPARSEKHFLRELPDSLDLVALTHADKLSDFDREDLARMKRIGTRVLYQLDYAVGIDPEKVLADIRESGLDGIALSAVAKLGDPAFLSGLSAAVRKFAAEKGKQGLLVYEGDPVALSAEDRSLVDLFVLDTQALKSTFEIRQAVHSATLRLDIPAAKLLLAGDFGVTVLDENLAEHPALELLCEKIMTLGKLGGLAVCRIDEDYYHVDGNYTLVRSLIQKLNPSK